MSAVSMDAMGMRATAAAAAASGGLPYAISGRMDLCVYIL